MLESGRLCFAKAPSDVLLAEDCEGLCGFCIVADEAAVEVGEPQEGLDFTDVAGFRPCSDSCDLGRIHMESLRR